MNSFLPAGVELHLALIDGAVHEILSYSSEFLRKTYNAERGLSGWAIRRTRLTLLPEMSGISSPAARHRLLREACNVCCFTASPEKAYKG